MRHTYLLRKPTALDLEFYRKCFSDKSWRKSYGFGEFENFEEDIQSIAFAEYFNVERFLVCRGLEILGFFHLQKFPDDERCVLSGGILPNMVKSGNGLRGLCLVLDYIFQKLKLNKVCCEVTEINASSQRILKRVGFQHEGILNEHRFDKDSKTFLTLHLFGMLRKNYPTPIIEKIIKRFDYEAK